MKKSNFVEMILSVIGILFLGLGMCMSTIPEWNMFQQGIILGCIGLLVLLVMAIVYRKMENMAPIKITLKTVLTVLLGIIGALSLGIGMCLTMVFGHFSLGIIIGIIGIIILLCLIPLCKGIK